LQDRRSLRAAAVFFLVARSAWAQPAASDRQQVVDAFNAANAAYRSEQYAVAAPLYEQVVKADPDIPVAYLYLASSYDHLFRADRRGQPDNDRFLNRAEQSYRVAADKLLALGQPEATRTATTCLEMLAGLYSPDRLHNPARARAVIQELIHLNPADPTYELSLAKLYEDSGAYADAEAALARAAADRPDDAGVYTELASHYWDIASHGSNLNNAQQRDFAVKGIAAADRALGIAPDDVDALVYKSRLLRELASIETDRKKRQQLVQEAGALDAKAKALRPAAPTPR
jgi:tetratricopeptide (TPR) repeat protein